MSKLGKIGFTTAAVSFVVLEAIGIAGWKSSNAKPKAVVPASAHVQQSQAVVAQASVQESPQAQQQAQPGAKPQPPVTIQLRRPEDRYYDQLRSRVRWVTTRMSGNEMKTPDLNSRMLLAKSAAQRAGLHEVGLNHRDVYGIINAETTWVPRMGASKDGTPNLGIAQFEPATARAVGLRDPNDLVEAIHAAAAHMKEAAVWSANRIAHLKLSADDRASKLREGVSIYYNLSSKGRSAWNGKNTMKLPVETRRHIANARIGAQQAGFLDAQLQAMGYGSGKSQSVAATRSGQNGS